MTTVADDVKRFVIDLTGMIEQGGAILHMLQQLSRQQKDKAVASMVDDIFHNIEAGCSLSEAMEKHPDKFESELIRVVRDGERQAKLDLALREYVDRVWKSGIA